MRLNDIVVHVIDSGIYWDTNRKIGMAERCPSCDDLISHKGTPVAQHMNSGIATALHLGMPRYYWAGPRLPGAHSTGGGVFGGK